MSTEREKTRAWLSEYVQRHHPRLVTPCLRVASAFDRAMEIGQLSQEDSDLIKDAARDRSSLLSEYAASLLGRLALRFPPAAEAINQLSKDRQVHARVNALVALESAPPCDLHATAGRVALNDRSRKVRELAADKVRGWRLQRLLPDIEQAIVRESDDTLRSTLEMQRDLMRNGYSVKPARGGVSIVCQAAGSGLTSTWVREDEFRTKGIAAIARQLGVDITSQLTGVASGAGDLPASKYDDDEISARR